MSPRHDKWCRTWQLNREASGESTASIGGIEWGTKIRLCHNDVEEISREGLCYQ